jgi:hypothetical protein
MGIKIEYKESRKTLESRERFKQSLLTNRREAGY